MNVTKFIKLFKPGYNETADIEILNQNSDKIDAQFEEQSKTLAGKEPIITKKSGFNLDKTDSTENDNNKLFTALGALNLKNWLVSNYTTLMNNIRESLTTLVNTKLPHGGYGGSGQDLKNIIDMVDNGKLDKGGYNGDAQSLKNLIDTKLPLDEAYKNFTLGNVGDTQQAIDKIVTPGHYQCGATGGKYHLSYLNVIAFYPNHIRQIHHDWQLGTQWRDRYSGDLTDIGWITYLDTGNINSLYCPYRVGDIIQTVNPGNPAATWIGTTWEKLENCFLYAHTSDTGNRGGNSAITLTTAQLPPHNHGTSYLRRAGVDGNWDSRPSMSASTEDANYYNSDNTGSGEPINIMPPHYTVFMWKRLS